MSKTFRAAFTASLVLNLLLIIVGSGIGFRYWQVIMNPEMQHLKARAHQAELLAKAAEPRVVKIKEERVSQVIPKPASKPVYH